MTLIQPDTTFTTLPRPYYFDESLFEAELERIWYQKWLYLAHSSEIPNPGDFVVRNMFGESVIVVRGRSGEISAMLNVCRHRGARIVDEPCGRLRRLVCPYHQWSYDLEGQLLRAPSMPDGEQVPYGELGLHQVQLETWNGFIFGCLSAGDAPPSIGAEIESLAPRLTEYEPTRLTKAESRTYTCSANWKVMLENYLECYHCAGSHPEFCVTADLDVRGSDEYSAHAWNNQPYWASDVALRDDTHSVSLTGERICRVPLHGPEELVLGRTRSFGDWAGAAVLYFNVDHVMVHGLRPVSTSETEFQLTWFISDQATEGDYDLEDLVRVWEATTMQDISLIERTQQGIRSRRYQPGPLSAQHEPYIRSSLNVYRSIMAGHTTYERLTANHVT